MAICSKCKGFNSRLSRYCHECHAAYMREWRKNNPPTEFMAECDQEIFNVGINRALESLKSAKKTHEQRMAFLEWADKRIKKEIEEERKEALRNA